MPILDSLKSALTDHLSTLVTRMTPRLKRRGCVEQGRGAGTPQITVTPQVTKIDDRTIAVTANFDTQQTSSQAIKEVALHGDTVLDTPSNTEPPSYPSTRTARTR